MNPTKPPPPSELPPSSRVADPPVDPPANPPLVPDAATAFRQALPSILRHARARGFDSSHQQDIAQDVAEWLLRHWDRYDPRRGTALQWATGVGALFVYHAHRRVARERRHIEVDPPLLPDRQDPDLTPEQLVRARETLALVQEVLDPEEQAIFELRARSWTASEIGEALGIPRWRVEQLVRDARARLLRRLRSLGENPKNAAQVRALVPPFALLADLEETCKRADNLEGPSRRLATWRARAGAVLPQLAAGVLLVTVLVGAALAVMTERALRRERADSLAMIVREDLEIAPQREMRAAVVPVAPLALEVPEVSVAPLAPEGSAPARQPNVPVAPRRETSGTLLLLRAAKLPPDEGLDAAILHAQQFPAQSPGRREKVISRAREALGRSGAPDAHETGLKGTLYEREESVSPRPTARQHPRAR